MERVTLRKNTIHIGGKNLIWLILKPTFLEMNVPIKLGYHRVDALTATAFAAFVCTFIIHKK